MFSFGEQDWKMKTSNLEQHKEIRTYNLGVVALQEIRWNDKGTLDLQDTTIFDGECIDRRQFGTGFAVHKTHDGPGFL